MMGKPISRRNSRNLLLGLLLATLLLSTGLNLYLLLEEPAYLAGYELEGPLLESAAAVELVQTRRALAECQAGHPLPPDSLATAAATAYP
ncbi:hypothetical protein KLP40_13680 [Hymenobacter sp. NST-14]|uniref:hypothetical protein n=1 Tax=Hymenobacter piscis TaxID=2839984 RepID=UPI001C01FCBA|nr:hypothetical protein [Hymenobacter piscis]MBT9394218.1 hypothetical protein [Hymenobacter piscis]